SSYPYIDMKNNILLLLFLASMSMANAKGLNPVYLRCEYKENPFTDVTNPRLSWEVTSDEKNQVQTAYQILVAASPEDLTESKATIWNSGKVAGRQTAQIVYQGKPMESRKIYYWKVRSWDKNGVAGPWSEA